MVIITAFHGAVVSPCTFLWAGLVRTSPFQIPTFRLGSTRTPQVPNPTTPSSPVGSEQNPAEPWKNSYGSFALGLAVCSTKAFPRFGTAVLQEERNYYGPVRFGTKWGGRLPVPQCGGLPHIVARKGGVPHLVFWSVRFGTKGRETPASPQWEGVLHLVARDWEPPTCGKGGGVPHLVARGWGGPLPCKGLGAPHLVAREGEPPTLWQGGGVGSPTSLPCVKCGRAAPSFVARGSN